MGLPEHWNQDTFRYDEWFGYQFEIPVYNVEFTLWKGLWCIKSHHHYRKIAMHPNGYFWLRELISDISRALYATEVWHADEYLTWFGGPLENRHITFEQWLKAMRAEIGKPIPEFRDWEILAQGDVYIPDYEIIYHDDYSDCNAIFDTNYERLMSKGYELLGLARIYNNTFRCRRNGRLVLVDANTLEPIFPESWEIFETLPCRCLVVKKDGLSAVFSRSLEQLTDFKRGKLNGRETHQPAWPITISITIRLTLA